MPTEKLEDTPKHSRLWNKKIFLLIILMAICLICASITVFVLKYKKISKTKLSPPSNSQPIDEDSIDPTLHDEQSEKDLFNSPKSSTQIDEQTDNYTPHTPESDTEITQTSNFNDIDNSQNPGSLNIKDDELPNSPKIAHIPKTTHKKQDSTNLDRRKGPSKGKTPFNFLDEDYSDQEEDEYDDPSPVNSESDTDSSDEDGEMEYNLELNRFEETDSKGNVKEVSGKNLVNIKAISTKKINNKPGKSRDLGTITEVEEDEEKEELHDKVEGLDPNTGKLPTINE